MIDPIINNFPLPLIGVLIVVGCLAARWLGIFVAKRGVAGGAEATRPGDDKSDIQSYISGAIFGLLAFMLGLTFSLALDRFDTRRGLVVDEANALSTTYMRLSLLDEPQATQTREYMRQYVHTRIAPSGIWTGETTVRLQQSRDARDRLWASIRAALWTWRSTDFASNILDPMNEAFDLGAKRELTARAHIPTRITEVLLIYLLVSAAVLGFLIGDQNRRRLHASSLVFVLYALSFVLILDIDRPQAGRVIVSQHALEELAATMDRDAQRERRGARK